MAKKIKINISNVTGNVVITAIAEMITSDEERTYITDLEGNRLLDSNSNYLIVDDDGNNDNNNEETSRIADLNGNTLLDSNSNYLIVDNNDNNDDNNDNDNDDGTIHYFVDKDGYLVLDKNQYKIAFKPSDSTE